MNLFASPQLLERPQSGWKPSIFRQRIGFYTTSLLLSMAWVWMAGKDVPWDAVHYHLYAGYSVFHDRLAIDYFPAGAQTYLTPYSHAPLYLMVQAGWSSLTIGMAFTCMHASALWLTWELARSVSQDVSGSSPAVVTWGAGALALANPVFLQELGSSFNDITTGAIVLAGYLALVQAFKSRSFRMVALGGLLLGVASALKMTNAVFALVPALPLVLGCAEGARARWRNLLLFALCACAALMLVGGPWAWALWQTFGNPVFPMLDNFFNPPSLAGGATVATTPASSISALMRTLDAVRDPRFLPSSFAEALMRPFDMLATRRSIHTETMAADARYAALTLLPALWLVVATWRRRNAGGISERASGRGWACLTISFAIAWALWLLISGNSRYFLPMGCVAAVVLAVGMYKALAGIPRAQGWGLAIVLGMQVVLLLNAADFRWNAQPWDGPWVQATIPTRFRAQPFLYLSMDSQSQSLLLPDLAEGSALIGMGPDVDPESVGGQHVRKLIDANGSRLRMLKLVKAFELDGQPIAPSAATFDYPLRRLGLRVDASDCTYLRYRGNPDVIEREGQRSGPRDQVYIYTCRLVAGGALSEVELAGKRLADLVLSRVEDACPEVFGARRASSVRNGTIWRRNYPDLATWVNDDGWVRFADLLRGGGDISGLGSRDEWLTSPPKLKCWRAGGRVYVERADSCSVSTGHSAG